ncbi:hypothetical protein FHS89_002815 [Rubricella aquisinus]|uniref:Uncharacterized protein n=1 Tax=Rubricella aquisinus TaxID=2028108 RepID=A0A840WRV9_9RHOB|nr:hypothetical protein [Rubricella aquisinus]
MLSERQVSLITPRSGVAADVGALRGPARLRSRSLGRVSA